MNFSQSTYGIEENAGPVQLELILNSPSTSNITVVIFSNDGSATGKFSVVITHFILLYCYLLSKVISAK